MEAIVDIKNVIKDYPLGNLTVRALHGVNLTIEKGEFTVIAGPSGSGKTTLLNIVGCVDSPTEGSVLVDGKATEKMNDKQRTLLRLYNLGFIFQSFNLIHVLTAAQNIEFPLLLQGKLSKKERVQRVQELVELVDLQDKAHHRPNELSGGQRQRVAIARALVTQPNIVLADEPTANLDSVTGLNIINLMKELNQKKQTTFIFSTHDQRVMDHARRIVTIEDGQIKNTNEIGG